MAVQKAEIEYPGYDMEGKDPEVYGFGNPFGGELTILHGDHPKRKTDQSFAPQPAAEPFIDPQE